MKCYSGDSVRLRNPYSIERKKRQQYLLLTRISVRGVEVPKDGLRLHVTCNNFNDSTMSTRVLAGLIQYGYILARPQGECIWLVARIGHGI